MSEEHEHKIDLRQDGGETEHHEQECEPGPGRLGDQGEDVVAKYEQVNGAIADSFDKVIFWEEFDKISQLEIKAGEEADGDEVIEQGIAEDNPSHNEISSGKSDDHDLLSVTLTDDMVRAEHDDQHVDAVEDVDQLAECRHVEHVHVDISKYQNFIFS